MQHGIWHKMAGGQNMEYGLIGKTLKHSFSKPIHESMCNYNYALQELPTQMLFENYMRNAEFKAINVTIPYKQDVIPYCSLIDEHAKQIGAVNTIVNKNGVLHGYNTDYKGFLYMARQVNVDFNGKNVLILGTGGTQRTVLAVVKDENAKHIYIAGRKAKRQFSCDDYTFIDYETAKKIEDIDIIVNTTPVGMYPNNYDAPLNLLHKPDGENYIYKNLTAVLDVIYNPSKTLLLQQASMRNLTVQNGLSMLVAQAKYAAEIFLGKQINDSEIKRVQKELSAKTMNIVIVGMPGSGKSHVGKLISMAMHRDFTDLDTQIVKHINVSIEQFFTENSEAAFRDIETEICKQAAINTGAVISTGGGTILRSENVNALKQNGVIIYIDRPLEELQKGKGRPLSKDENAVKILYEKRAPIYNEIADIIIKNNVSAQKAAEDCEGKYNEYFSN